MNIQTEKIENHRIRLTVELGEAEVGKAMRQVARDLSRRVPVPGFRRGRAPYRLILRTVGEELLREEAVERLADKAYRSALEETDIETYGAGELEDFTTDPPVLVFVVPLWPEVILGDYRSVRKELEVAPVSEADVDEQLQKLRQQRAEVLDTEVAVSDWGHRVTLALTGEYLDGEEADTGEQEAALEDALSADAVEAVDEDASAIVPKKGDIFVDDDNFQFLLNSSHNVFWNEFAKVLVGLEKDEQIEIEMKLPVDVPELGGGLADRRVQLNARLKEIAEVDVPELDDAFARQLSRERGEEEMDLARFRAYARENLEMTALAAAKRSLYEALMAQIIAEAQITYPDAMLEQQIDDLVNIFFSDLEDRGLTRKNYFRFTNSTEEEMRENFYDEAISVLRRNLVMLELMDDMNLEISDEDLDRQVELLGISFGQATAMRRFYKDPKERNRLRNSIAAAHIQAQLLASALGEDMAAASEALWEEKTADMQEQREQRERRERYEAEDAAAAAASPPPAAPATENA